MKKLLVTIIVVVILAASAMPALAAGGQNRNGVGNGSGYDARWFSLAGVITAIDGEAHTLTVLVMAGNRQVHPFIGQELVISTDENTRYLLRTEDGCIPITFDDLAIELSISVRGQKLQEAWLAMRVTVGAELPRILP